MDFISKNEKICDYLKNNLSSKRYKHVMNVAEEAQKLCDLYGGDKEKCVTASLFHDMVREKSKEELNQLVCKFNLPDKYKGNSNVSHGKVAAELMKRDWGIDDEDIINAVSYHTTGRPCMSQTEKIVFIADAIEKGRDYEGVDYLRKATYENLDKGCLAALSNTIKHLEEKGIDDIDEDTVEAEKWFKENRKGY